MTPICELVRGIVAVSRPLAHALGMPRSTSLDQAAFGAGVEEPRDLVIRYLAEFVVPIATNGSGVASR